jgi:hypothetical protein
MAVHSTSWLMTHRPRSGKAESGGPVGRWLLGRAVRVLVLAVAAQPALAADALTPLDLRQVKVSGELGRHIDMTVTANLLSLDVDRVFLQPFRTRNQPSGYIGLGNALLLPRTGDALWP